jgi:demethylmenaquinone methyltransferase/2-methoxy-6-polyprenyl-1,4-benzoquinol methylase
MRRDGAENPNRFAKALFAGLPLRYDRLAELLSMGQNARWRRAMVDHVLPSRPSRVLDVASGTAGVAIQLASRSDAHVVGVDLSSDMLREGHRNVARASLGSRIQLVGGRGEQLPFPDESFDAMTFTYLLRYVDDPAATLAELARVVRAGGVVASLEFLVPPRPFWHIAWIGYTRFILPVAGWLTGGMQWWEVGRFLGPNISDHYRHYPVDWTVKAWESAGFEDVGYHEMSLGGGLVMWGRKARS